MSTPYEPVCNLCRTNAAGYYKSCQGCQARRAVAMAAFHKAREDRLPVPSIDKPKEPS